MRNPHLLLIVVALSVAACTSAVPMTDEILVSTAEAAVFVGDVGEAVFWDVPRFVVWTAPRAFFYEMPRQGILALAGTRTRVEALVGRLDGDDLTVDEEVEVSTRLGELTGIPLRSRQAWSAWWEEARELPESRWLDTFVERQLALLESPDYFRRSAALSRLTALYGTTLGYDPKEAVVLLRAGADRWRAHVASAGVPEPQPLPRSVQVAERRAAPGRSGISTSLSALEAEDRASHGVAAR